MFLNHGCFFNAKLVIERIGIFNCGCFVVLERSSLSG